jgi:hypothetical protein
LLAGPAHAEAVGQLSQLTEAIKIPGGCPLSFMPRALGAWNWQGPDRLATLRRNWGQGRRVGPVRRAGAGGGGKSAYCIPKVPC